MRSRRFSDRPFKRGATSARDPEFAELMSRRVRLSIAKPIDFAEYDDGFYHRTTDPTICCCAPRGNRATLSEEDQLVPEQPTAAIVVRWEVFKISITVANLASGEINLR